MESISQLTNANRTVQPLALAPILLPTAHQPFQLRDYQKGCIALVLADFVVAADRGYCVRVGKLYRLGSDGRSQDG